MKSKTFKQNKDFRRLYYRGKSKASDTLVTYAMKKRGGSCKYGITTSKKIGNAVARNWVKRRIRQSLTELKPQLKQDCDFIVIARPGVAFMSTAEVKQHLIHVLHLAKVLNDDQVDSDLR